MSGHAFYQAGRRFADALAERLRLIYRGPPSVLRLHYHLGSHDLHSPCGFSEGLPGAGRCALHPRCTLPGRALSRRALSGRALPGGGLPGRALPGRALPGRALPGRALPGGRPASFPRRRRAPLASGSPVAALLRHGARAPGTLAKRAPLRSRPTRRFTPCRLRPRVAARRLPCRSHTCTPGE